MARYERKRREGFMLYHDDFGVLTHLSPKAFRELMLSLFSYSIALSRGEEPAPHQLSGLSASMFIMMKGKLDRDHAAYHEKCDQASANRSRPRQGDGGQPRSSNRNPPAPPTADASADAGASADEPQPGAVPGDFAPPSPGEVSCYAQRNGLQLDADAFCDYYAARGWHMGGQPMQDWQAAVRLWARREAVRAPTAREKAVREQQYSQREYTHSEAEVDAMMAAYIRSP
ncbi:MAG: hypothetical protein IJ438_07870 [Clostridia bacterium]|nr:hypothetical protein [Clostridia bacterium]